MISARDELLHLVDCLSDEECERALALLEPLSRPTPAEFDPAINCVFCSAVSTGFAAVEHGWAASFWHGGTEYEGPVCGRCLAGGALLKFGEEHSDWELLPGVPLPPAVVPLDGPASAADAEDQEPRPLVIQIRE